MEDLLEIKNLNTYFKTPVGEVKAVCDVNLSIRKGEVLGLIGETGCGKSVLGETIIKVLPKNAVCTGSISFEGNELVGYTQKQARRLRGRKIAVIPQNPAEALNPLIKNGRQVDESVLHNRGIGYSSAKKVTLGLLEEMNFQNAESVYDEYPHRLSGGMKQRVLASMGLSGDPELLIADEPTKGLDTIIRGQVIETLSTFRKKTNSAMLIITHDLNFAIKICDRIAVMYAGEIVEIGTPRELFTDARHPYLRGLILSQPENGLIPIKGTSPSLLNLPSGCRFCKRCSFASDKCISTHPDMHSVSETHGVRCCLNV